MEGQSEVNPDHANFNKKSPQELASQMESVTGTSFEFAHIPEGKSLDERYKQSREYLAKLQEAGIGDEQLNSELDQLYQAGEKLGIYCPLRGEKSDKFLAVAKEQYLGWGYSEEEAEAGAKATLASNGYLEELRNWRRGYERDIKKLFSGFIESNPLNPQEEQERKTKLKESCYFLDDSETARRLKQEFPGGNYLYHGTKVEQAIEILATGSLVNTKTLLDREEERHEREGGDKKSIRKNSGYEGVSWNFNEIGALPGDRYHIAGFLASPATVLTDQLQLAVPSRPAPNELILINSNIDAQTFYSLKTQQELVESFSLGENNSVLSNIVELSMYRENESGENKNLFASDSILVAFSQKEMTDEQMTEILRSRYSVRSNGTIEFSPSLLQQIKKDIPVAAVWFQALIDTGRIRTIPGFEKAKTVREIISLIDKVNDKAILAELRKERRYLDEAAQNEDNKIESIQVAVSDMFLVVSDLDLDKWLNILARTSVQPKGIIVYPHNSVRLENFATLHRGDNQALSDLLRNTLPPSEGWIDYEEDILSEKITEEKIAGHRKHVIGEQFLTKRKSLRLKNNIISVT